MKLELAVLEPLEAIAKVDDFLSAHESVELLEKARKICPESKLIEKCQKLNDFGTYYFYYILHRAAVEKKMEKY